MLTLLHAALMASLFSTSVVAEVDRPASCEVNRPASITRAVTPQYPVMVQPSGATGKSIIRVDLSNTGSVSGAFVATSSGSLYLDREALRAVMAMGYAPEMRSCATVGGSYAVEVEFPD